MIFRFKSFDITRRPGVFQPGTDAVLLGASAQLADTSGRVLDVGTGSGILALMLAHRFPDARINAIDISKKAVRSAKLNVNAGPYRDRIVVAHSDFNTFTSSSLFSDIICNPPFFKSGPQSSLYGSARHESKLAFSDLIFRSQNLIAPQGKLHVILPADRFEEIEEIASQSAFGISRITRIRHDEKSARKRVLTEMIKTDKVIQAETSELIIRNPGGEFSGHYRALTRDFHPFF